jgi:outer membrane lipoprotein-sorting protein
MIKRWRVKTLFLTGFFCLALFRPVFSQEAVVIQAMTAEQLTADISQKWSNIQDFQSDMTVGMQMFGKMMKIKGTIWQKGKLFRAEMTLPSELMPPTDKSVGPLKVLVIFDGKIMWQSLPMMNMVTKSDISALEGKTKNVSFSKSFYSLPAVSYQLSEKKRNGNDCYFLETKDTNKFIQNSPAAGLGVNLPMNMSFQSIGVWINKTTLFPDLIEFYVQNNTPGMSLEFKNIKTDQGLTLDLFTFQVPEGVQVMDVTASMKAIAGKTEKQSTISDTIQTTTEKTVKQSIVSDTIQAATVPDTGQAPQ